MSAATIFLFFGRRTGETLYAASFDVDQLGNEATWARQLAESLEALWVAVPDLMQQAGPGPAFEFLIRVVEPDGATQRDALWLAGRPSLVLAGIAARLVKARRAARAAPAPARPEPAAAAVHDAPGVDVRELPHTTDPWGEAAHDTRPVRVDGAGAAT